MNIDHESAKVRNHEIVQILGLFVLSRFRDSILLAVLITLVSCSTTHAQDAKQRMFERVFGGAVKLDPAMIAKVKASKPGEYVLVDRDGDGKHDEAWFIDTSPRHTAAVRPLLVRAIDEDGDLDRDGQPDLDSDLYVADWKADGSVDAVIDYTDTDHDNDVDEMAMYFWSPNDHFLGKDALRVWWGRDDGDDNQLWYDVDYTYDQKACQWRSHFSGDESFVAFGLTEGSDQWQSIWENPFLFYDRDHDGCSDEVIRFSGLGDQVEALRWSFDADDDAHGRHTHDYDFSITAIAPGSRFTRGDNRAGSDLTIPAPLAQSITLRGIPTQPWLQRQHAQEFAKSASWAKAMLTWDEINANTDVNVAADLHERWEGVIAQGNKDFPQVGGPPCGPLNKRFELLENPKPPLRLYYAPGDGRIHLFGAKRGWMDVDYNLDGKVDARYEWLDQDGDGYFDRRRLDVDADGTVDFIWMIGPEGRLDVPLDSASIVKIWTQELRRTLETSQPFVDAMIAAVALADGEKPTSNICPAMTYYREKLPSWMPNTRLGDHIRTTAAGAAFYTNFARDWLQRAVWTPFGEHGAAYDLYPLTLAGKYNEAADLVLKQWVRDAPKINTRNFGAFQKRIPITIANADDPQRDDWPVTIRLSALKAAVSDFNADNCAVVAPHRWLDWRAVPHQVDTIDPAIGAELSFLADVPANAIETWFIYYSPTGRSPTTFPARTSTAEDWVPPNIGWESNRCAYRAYWDQFDFFGKKSDSLIYPTIARTSYHSETPWGIDALHVGKASGLGGLTIYANDKPFIAQNPAGDGKVEFKKRQVCHGPIRAVAEIVARNILPQKPDVTLQIRCVIYAERQESQVDVKVVGADGPVLLAPGLVKLTHEQAFTEPRSGFIGSWGWQETGIGDIGMAIMTSPDRIVDVVDLPEERRVRCRPDESNMLRYWIIGDWRRGRAYPAAPTLTNWNHEVGELAKLLLHDVQVSLGSAQSVSE